MHINLIFLHANEIGRIRISAFPSDFCFSKCLYPSSRMLKKVRNVNYERSYEFCRGLHAAVQDFSFNKIKISKNIYVGNKFGMEPLQ